MKTKLYDISRSAAANEAYPPIGTVSHGTMRDEDLIPDFMDVLRRYNPKRAKQLENDNPDVFAWIKDTGQDEPEFLSEFTNETLWDAMNEIAPPYCYFGATEGDGCDYGFWPSMDSLEEDVTQGGVAKMDMGEPWPKVVGYIMAVTDHGNVTLYERKRNGHVSEVWSTV